MHPCRLVFALVIACSSMVLAQTTAFMDFGVGYTQLDIGGSVTEDLDGADGFGLLFRVGIGPAAAEGWRFGVGLDISSYEADFGSPDLGTVGSASSKELNLYIPEITVGYQFPIGAFFIEPRVGIGLGVGNFRGDNVVFEPGETEDVDDWEVAPSIRPGIRAGVGIDHVAFGVEASYLYTNLDFGRGIGGDIGKYFVGGFVQFRF